MMGDQTGNVKAVVPVKHLLTFKEKLGVFRAIVVRNFILLTRFRISALVAVIGLFVSLASFFFLNAVITPNPIYFGSFGEQYLDYIVIGTAFFAFSGATLGLYLNMIRGGYFSNRLELILASPLRLRGFLTFLTFWALLFSALIVTAYLCVGVLVFGVHISPTAEGAWILILVFLLTTLSLSGIGLLSGSMFLLMDVKGKLEPVSWFFSTFAGLLSGVVFPREVFLDKAPILYELSKFFPHTYALDAFRRLLVGATLTTPTDGSIVFFDVIMLTLFAVALFPMGLLCFTWGIRKAERDGGLARWGG